jgi:hypothetical protein
MDHLQLVSDFHECFLNLFTIIIICLLGKSLTSYAFLRWLVSNNNGIIGLHIKMPGERWGDWSFIVTVFYENHFSYVVHHSLSNEEVGHMFIDSIRSIRPHIVIIDGLRSEVQHVIDAILFHSHQTFYVFTSSQQLLLPVLRHQKILNVNPWRHEDYLEAVKTDCLLMDPVVRQNLCITDQDDEITIRKKIDEKYYIAGYNCRFLFDYSVEEVKSIIDTHIGTLIICDFANRVNPTPTTSVAMNALISLSDCEGKKKGSPVSAYLLERLAKEFVLFY